MDRIEATCPACGSSYTIGIVRDMPGLQLPELEREHWMVLAGSPVEENDPDWRCRACGYEWIEPTNTTSPT
jgi:transposase-like protein